MSDAAITLNLALPVGAMSQQLSGPNITRPTLSAYLKLF